MFMGLFEEYWPKNVAKCYFILAQLECKAQKYTIVWF
jgi:hypothetical protein